MYHLVAGRLWLCAADFHMRPVIRCTTDLINLMGHHFELYAFSCIKVCMCFYGAYNYSGLVRQVSGFSNVSFSAPGTCRFLDCWILGRGKAVS